MFRFDKNRKHKERHTPVNFNSDMTQRCMACEQTWNIQLANIRDGSFEKNVKFCW